MSSSTHVCSLIIAGEATCQKLQGDTHAAIVSGLREAHRLLVCIQLCSETLVQLKVVCIVQGGIADSSSWPMFDPKIRTLCEELLYPDNDDDTDGDDDRPAV